MKKFLAVLILSMFATAITGHTQESMTIDDIERLARVENSLEMLNKLEQRVESLTKNKNRKCLMAVGSLKFCKCISDETPVFYTFNDYIEITTNNKTANKYEKLSGDERKMYDLVRPVRDKCVKESGF